MKRFWKTADVEPVEDGFGIALDGRSVRTPGRNPLVVPSAALAEGIAQEWRDVGETVDPRAMMLTGLANAAIDRISIDPESFAADLAAYGETDLLCYRADSPDPLVARQVELWDPHLVWARDRYDVHFSTATGVMHVAQPPETVARLREAVCARDPFALAGLSPLVTITGSLVLALALAERAVEADAAWNAAMLDELWQAEQWGEDAEAAQARTQKRTEYDAALRFLRLLERENA